MFNLKKHMIHKLSQSISESTNTDSNPFLDSYIEAALWSSIGDDGEPLDTVFTKDDIAQASFEKMKNDCDEFLNGSLTSDANDIYIGNQLEKAGHDFWLTRNRHGSGFWDGDWGKGIGEKLTTAAHQFGECHLYVGDDGKLYVS